MNISGIEIVIGIKFKEIINNDYLNVATKIQDDIADLIENMGYEFVMCSSKPIDKSDL